MCYLPAWQLLGPHLSLTKLSSLLSCAFAGAMAGKQTASALGNAEAQRSAASKRAAWLARGVGLSRASRDACRALPGDAGLRCKASACSMHHASWEEAFLACLGLTKTLVLRCCTGTVCLCSPKGLYDPQVHMLVKSHCYIRMLSDRECIFYEYLRPVAV